MMGEERRWFDRLSNDNTVWCFLPMTSPSSTIATTEISAAAATSQATYPSDRAMRLYIVVRPGREVTRWDGRGPNW